MANDPTYTGTPVLSKIKIGEQLYYLKDDAARSVVTTIYNDYLKAADKIELTGLIDAEEKRALAAEAQVLVDAKAYTDTKVGQIILIKYEVVTTLPTADADHEFNKSKTIYLKSESGSGKEQDVYGEYICIKVGSNYQWEKIGDTRIDLSNYYTKAEVDAAILVETNRAKGAEGDLADDIAEVAEDLAAEVTRADTAEKANAAAISAEETRAKGVEGGLNTRLTTAEGAIETLEGKVETIEGKPAYGITTQQITNWNNEVGAKAAVEAEKERAIGVEEGLDSRLTQAELDIDAIEGKEAGWDAKLNTVKLGGEFKTVSTDATYGKYVDLGTIATSEELEELEGRVEAAEADIDQLESDITKLEVKGQTISGVKATGTSTGELTGALGYASTGMTSTGSVTAAGSVTLNAFTQTATDITSTGKVTAAGDVEVATTEVAASKVKTTGTLPTFTAGAFTPNTPTVIDVSKFNGGSVATFSEGAFTPASLTYAASDSFCKEGIKARVGTSGEELECLVFEDVTNKGTASVISAFSGGSKAADTFNGGSAASLGTGFYTAGTAASKAADTFTQGAMPTFDEVKADKVGTATFTGSEVNVSVSGQYDKATANGASFSGSAVEVSVSGNYDKANIGTVAFSGKAISLDVGDIVVADKNVTKKA